MGSPDYEAAWSEYLRNGQQGSIGMEGGVFRYIPGKKEVCVMKEPEYIDTEATFGCGHKAMITTTLDSVGPDLSMARDELCPSCEREKDIQEEKDWDRVMDMREAERSGYEADYWAGFEKKEE